MTLNENTCGESPVFSLDWQTAEKSAAHLRFILCLQGGLSLRIDAIPLSLSACHLLACPAQAVLTDIEQTSDFQCLYIGITSGHLRRILAPQSNHWEIKLLINRLPLLDLSSGEVQEFREYLDLLSRKQGTVPFFRGKERDALLSAFGCYLADLVCRRAKYDRRPFSAGETLFKKFIELLTSLHPKPRTLGYYAETLCVTPKYLSTTCKNCSGQTASQLIDFYVTKDIEYLLKYTTKSIKEICIELDFPNLSFFGRYVKKHLGISPRAYRERME